MGHDRQVAHETYAEREGDLIDTDPFSLFVLACIVGGFIWGIIRTIRWYHSLLTGGGGWLWFTTDPKNKHVARVGLTEADPATFVPPHIKVLHKMPVKSRADTLLDVAKNLSSAHVKAQWYDLEAVKAYISHLKGEW